MQMRLLVLSLTALLAAAMSAAGLAETTPRDRAAARVEARFAAADVNDDGYLTLPEAREGMPVVYRNFEAIDRNGNGGVTEREIQSFLLERASQRPVRQY